MKLRYAPRAFADIADIYQYIAHHDTRAATAVVRQVQLTGSLLAEYPGLGRETNIPGVRVLPTSRYSYLVYHQVQEGEVIIIHVRDGRRDAPNTGEFST